MGFLNSAEHTFKEVDQRRGLRNGLLRFGISYLDDAMVGILRNDLILIGAGSGAGKTQTCCNIARANIEQGKKVHYIALEAEYLEIERRIKYQLFAKSFLKDSLRPKGVHISFQNWMLGDYIDNCTANEAEAANEFLAKYQTLFTYYKSDKFDANDLIATVLECAEDTDLIILDHVHYMDFDDDNENRAVKHIAKTARSLALEQGKPIILVSHVRKRDRFANEFAPGLEEFHGSSDLYKIATKAITIGPGAMTADGKIETYFRIVKNRFEGSVTRYIGKAFYNSREGSYDSSYEIGDAYANRDAGFKQLDKVLYPAWGSYTAGQSSNGFDDAKGQQNSSSNTGGPKAFSTRKNPYQG